MLFFILFSSVLFGMYLFVGWRFIYPLEVTPLLKTILGLIMFLFYCLPLLIFYFHFNRIDTPFTRVINWLGYTGLGTVSLLFFIQLGVEFYEGVKLIIGKTHQFDPRRRAFLGLTAKQIAGGLAATGTLWGVYTATKKPEIVKIDIPIENLPPQLKGLRLAQITDLHVGSMITGKFVKQVTDSLKSLNADMVFFTGDAADGSVEHFGKYMDSFSTVRPKYGKFFVTGNHEYYSDMNGWLRKIESLGFKILVNESQNIVINGATLMITGIPDRGGRHFSKFHRTDMEKAVGGMAEPDAKILLAHQPKDVEHAVKYNFNLQLSGHTHGGQYFPFSLLVQLAHPFIKGLHKRENTWIYVNQGTGYWGPPMRIGTVPEITEITLV
ncbi:MAG: metallophosphoesterase [Candidatus Marinimicrobia bacterium]|nr:metallophosphoesterase [Candidatus Neomarinimicrobiota bacterium]